MSPRIRISRRSVRRAVLGLIVVATVAVAIWHRNRQPVSSVTASGASARSRPGPSFLLSGAS